DEYKTLEYNSIYLNNLKKGKPRGNGKASLILAATQVPPQPPRLPEHVEECHDDDDYIPDGDMNEEVDTNGEINDEEMNGAVQNHEEMARGGSSKDERRDWLWTKIPNTSNACRDDDDGAESSYAMLSGEAQLHMVIIYEKTSPGINVVKSRRRRPTPILLLYSHLSHLLFVYQVRMDAMFLSPLVQGVLEKSVLVIQGRLVNIWGVETELAKLQSTLSVIQAVLEDAEEKQTTDRALTTWLAKLKDAAYDAEDILDEFYYEDLRREVAQHHRQMIEKVKGFFSSCINSLWFRIRVAPKIKEMVERLDDIAAERSKFHLNTAGGIGGGGNVVMRLGMTDRLQSHSFIIDSEVISREEDKMKIVELLISQSGSRSATVVPIWGIGGLGKTTLAQMVYNDERVVQHFHKRIWVCVSDDFDVRKIVRAIIESATKKKCRVSDMDPLQEELREILSAKRFLLVLDDVWNENEEKWYGLKDLLTVGADGSSVIVTTRSKIVSSIVGTVEAYQLAPLSEQDCWILFKKRAFESTEEPQKLATIGKQIVKKCGGLPLAAKTLGSLMRLKSEEWEWRSVMQSEIWESRDDGILPSLRLSYNHLPSHLKQCFSYCAIFPEHYEIDKDNLIQLWMANGLIPSQGNMEFEEKGHEIFTELAWRCFFQEVKEIKRWYDSDTKTMCKMHDLIHDLASSIMANECHIFDNPKSISNRNSKIRHLSINYFADLSNIDTLSSAKTLRTLLLLSHGALVNPHSRATLSKNMYLRVLDLSYTSISDCHISMERFKLLRYLDISFSDIETLPGNICSLVCLQTLKLIHCEGLLQLPRGMRNMTNLRHLYLDGCYSLRCMPKGMGHLKHLRTPTRYILGNESGSGSIGELKNLNLQGMLELCNLKNVNSEEDARDVNLGSKHYLQVLKLDWGMSADLQEEGNVENVLEALQPPHSLKRITLRNYRGTQFPAWLMQDPMLFNNLVEIILTGCNRCEHLPQLGQLPFLEILEMENMDSVKYMGGTSFYGSAGTDQNSTLFPSLSKIRLHNMANLEEWEGIRERPSFPQLASLKISSCPKLKNIPLFPTTRNLEIEYCSALLPAKGFFGCMKTLERLEMHECPKLTLHVEQEEVETWASLQELMIRGCQEPMFSLSSLGLWKKMKSLQSLSVEWCDGLNFLPVEVLQGLSSLMSANLLLSQPNWLIIIRSRWWVAIAVPHFPNQGRRHPTPMLLFHSHLSHLLFVYQVRMDATMFLSPFVEMVLKKSVLVIQGRMGNIWGVEKELARLQSTLSVIQAVLEDAEEKQPTDRALTTWLAKLKDAAYDADDILDEFYYEDLRREVAQHHRQMIEKVKGFFSSCINFLWFRIRVAPKIKEMVERIDDIAAERSKFHLNTAGGIGGGGGNVVMRLGMTDRLQTHSFISESEVISREEDKMKIVELLISQSGSRSATVVPIWGIGGLGKTTLAQMVYNDERVVQHFHKRIWVCVSDDFDVRKIVRAIIESATKKKCRVSDMDPLQEELREILSAKRFLLVLDDVWNENEEKWYGLKDLLTVGADGSSVIVTTRSKMVSSIVGTVEAYQLAPLSEQDCWILFKKRAFESTEEPQKLATIGKEIVKKCGGLPLAAKTLGSLMRLKSEEWEWRSVMQSEIWESRDDGILPSLRLSYNHLPSHLKQCFSYCAIFPKDYEIDKDNLIQLWMANGLIPTQGNMEFEEKGHEIFTELAWRCFFQEVKEIKRWYDSDTKTICKMHDLIHDLASSIMANECHIFDNPKSISNRNSKIRHLSINYFADLSNIDTLSSAKTLRTLLLLSHGALDNPHSRATLSKNMYLRVLDLSYTSISDCHISMERFKLLRYLDISFSNIETLPENTCSLIYLQTLKLIHCEGLLQLPRGMRNMTNLRHLYLDGCYSLRCMPKGMGHLKHLRTLTRYILGNESGSGSIGELKNLNLQGMLELCNLKNVNSEEDARDVNLGSKHYLQVLKLDWGMSADLQEEGHVENVLEALQPPHSLKRITLRNYRGTQFPAWLMQDPMLFNNLVEIILTGCNRCEHLPQLGQLPFLEILEMENMDSVKYMGGTSFYGSAGTDQNSTLFPSLSKIRLHNMANLEEWEGIRERPSFPQLASLKISSCPKLKNIPLFPTTRNLDIEYCSALLPAKGFFGCMKTLERLEMHECPKLTLLVEQEEVETRAALQELTIRGCQEPMFSLSSLGLWKKMNSLQSLSVEWCDGLNFLPVEVLQGLSSLICLRICYCRNLIGSSSSEVDGGLQLQYLTSLEMLAITGCEKLANLPQDSLKHLTTLKVIELGGFQNMTILPEFPESLLQAMIAKCPKVFSLPAGLGCCTALVRLRIQDLPNLSSWPEGRQGLNALEELTITDCPNLISLPNSLLLCLRNLKCLWVKNCPDLERQCMAGGAYWGFVSDIPVRSMMAAVEHDNSGSSRGCSLLTLMSKFVAYYGYECNRSKIKRTSFIWTDQVSDHDYRQLRCSAALLKAEKDLLSDLRLQQH
ncbi:uncharacterized protein LOC113461540, partial [Phoenix dactylifera]|uniref:Uncharacterized protein LOC113461540 n=1 Tax=Phoenix dactylifera TaxID=42345 RepID=A0A8B8ZGS5_PHODC